jgi:hypothetical protein
MKKDILAAGARQAQFGGPSHISQATWDEIWSDYKPEVEYEKKKEDELVRSVLMRSYGK